MNLALSFTIAGALLVAYGLGGNWPDRAFLAGLFLVCIATGLSP